MQASALSLEAAHKRIDLAQCLCGVGLAEGDDDLAAQFSPDMVDWVRPGILTGSPAEMVDRIGAYVDAGAQQLNIARRAPFDLGALERFAAEVVPAFR